MSTDSNGIANSREITFDQLKELKLAPGDVVWKKKSGKAVTLCKAGDQIDVEYISKFEKVTKSLWLENLLPESIKEQATEILLKLKEEKFDRERSLIRADFIALIKPYLWDGNKELCLFELVLIFNESFSRFTPAHILSLESVGLDLYKRSTYEASLNVLIAFIVGYLDYEFLSEVYHVTFYQHFEFSKNRPSLSSLEAIEYERSHYGELADELKEHAKKSILEFKKDLPYDFKNNSIIKLIERHQERLAGEGYPHALNKDELGDLDRIFILSNTQVKKEMVEDARYSASGLLKQVLNDTSGDVIEHRLKSLVEISFKEDAA